MLFKIGDKVRKTRNDGTRITNIIKKIYKIHATAYKHRGGVLQVIPGNFDDDILGITDNAILMYMWFADSCELVENKCICPI